LATATFDLKSELRGADALPALWRQRHVYFLAATVALQLAGCRGLVFAMDKITSESGETMLFGALLAQCFLLALWGALGGLTTLPRWGLVGLIFVAGVAAISVRMPLRSDDSWTMALEWGIIGAVLVLLFAVLLLPFRRLAGWRVDFDRRFYRGVGGQRGQLSVIEYAAYSVSIAAALAALRLAVQGGILGVDVLPQVAGVIATVSLTAAPVAYFIVVGRRLWLAMILSLAWTLAVAAMHSLLAGLHESLDLFGYANSAILAGMRLHLLGYAAGIALLTVFTLLPLRLIGLQLIVVPLREE